ncbi:MAG: hypothetical protein J6M44_17380 [Butyrivibrio sp.]|uniref:hypothetical protein n=1 Tax=Butyrivibrio sp. TaxID=28121 RepID=UPI001B73C6AC|nr:hypothetical protein [Butyrivibrio sp.]MBP3280721.1 hypothetical protein [Butyrivibrio sp.]MBP3782110.1 hypothetical protein [Butyrivibrio sp.]
MKKKIAFVIMLLIYTVYSIVTHIAAGYGGVVGTVTMFCWIAFTMPVVSVIVGVISDTLFQKKEWLSEN